jgi:hypothetical protein
LERVRRLRPVLQMACMILTHLVLFYGPITLSTASHWHLLRYVIFILNVDSTKKMARFESDKLIINAGYRFAYGEASHV